VAGNVSEMFADTGKTITGLFNEWDSDASFSEVWAIQSALREEAETRKQMAKTQEKLADAQIKYMNAKTNRIKSGDAMITVNGDGLQPHLEMIMWELLKVIQVRMSEEGVDSLLLGGVS